MRFESPPYYPCWTNRESSTHACAILREQRYRFFRDAKQADYERIRHEVFVERGRPRGFIASWGWSLEIDRRVDAFLRANYTNEIATLMLIGPDYLAITRHVVEDSEGIAAPTT